MAINSTLVTTAGQDIFTCPGTPSVDEQEHAVTCIMFCNYSGSDEVINIYALGPAPAAVGPVYNIIHDLTIPAGETFTFDTEKMVLSQGDRIYAVTSTANDRVTATVSSMRVS
jgi:hypothetical protein